MSTQTYTAADCAEQAGSAIASNCLDGILASKTQAEAMAILQTALLDLQRFPYQDRAAGGFAVMLVNVIELGLNAAAHRSAPGRVMDALYQHPDGMGELQFDVATSRLFTLNDAEGLSAFVSIGPAGLRDVASKLLALANEAEVPR